MTGKLLAYLFTGYICLANYIICTCVGRTVLFLLCLPFTLATTSHSTSDTRRFLTQHSCHTSWCLTVELSSDTNTGQVFRPSRQPPPTHFRCRCKYWVPR